MPPEPLIDLDSIDFSKLIADKEAIRRVNPQRFEMEHLDGIVYFDATNKVFVGYKDVGADEFWVRGHMPGYPLLPGVIICEAAAQLCSYFVVTQKLMEGAFIGFGGMENVRFRVPVKPGDRLVLIAQSGRVRPRQGVFSVQGFVGKTMVFHGDIIGVPIRKLD
jgi:3-hydroxyacyl-[acyl-carrier-protein] dehydratase